MNIAEEISKAIHHLLKNNIQVNDKKLADRFIINVEKLNLNLEELNQKIEESNEKMDVIIEGMDIIINDME